MKPAAPVRAAPRAAFTLIELIGVLAIVAIMASVLVPNVLKSVDRAAVTAEVETMRRLGDQVRLYLRINGTVPAAANWTTAVGTLADLSPADLATNRRNMGRVFVLDPAATPAPRALLISSMRNGLALPPATAITTAAQFQAIWQTADRAVPPVASWGGWAAWNAVARSGDYLVIERINLLPIYNTDLLALTLTLNNRGAATASYNLVLPNGTSQAVVNVAAGSTVVLANQRPRTRLNLYRGAGGASLDYTYVVSSTGRTFDFNGSAWVAQ